MWGSATSSYQIEGAVDADGRGESIWDRFCTVPGAIKDGPNGDVACDHYHRYSEDIALMRRLNLNAYRFSIAWPRILRMAPGRSTRPASTSTIDWSTRCLAAGIQPFPTLYHWDLPQVLEDRGGWPVTGHRRGIRRLRRGRRRARLGDRVDNWMTLNEPFVVGQPRLPHRRARARAPIAGRFVWRQVITYSSVTALAMERVRAAVARAPALASC